MYTIRPAEPADRDVIIEFNCRLALESEGLSLDRELTAAGVDKVLSDPARGQYWLALDGGGIVGQLMITLEWSDWRCGWFWWIQSVYVHPDHRGRGVYRMLYQHVVNEARERDDVCGIRLYVEKENESARRVYDRTGLKPANYEMRELDFRRPARVGD